MLYDLPDLDTENAYVEKFFNEWISRIVKKYKFDGIRIDTMRHVRKTFW